MINKAASDGGSFRVLFCFCGLFEIFRELACFVCLFEEGSRGRIHTRNKLRSHARIHLLQQFARCVYLRSLFRLAILDIFAEKKAVFPSKLHI